jgi:predicted short-subunit dehydrogenase-like oxidoreductase (DUF2520 family)
MAIKMNGQPVKSSARPRREISIIGAGNWGSSLAAALNAAQMPLAEVVVRAATLRRPALSDRVVTMAKAALDAEILWICVPDRKIASVAARIAARRPNLSGQVVLHSSGALTVGVLEAVRRAGAAVGGVAPIFSFPTREPISLKGIIFAVEVDEDADPKLLGKLTSLVRKLGGRPLPIAAEQKALYHAAATMASPLLVSAIDAAVAVGELAGLERRSAEAAIGALATGTLRNYLERGRERSFSGVFARGDAETVAVHLQALLAHPMLHSVYLSLARNAVATLN